MTQRGEDLLNSRRAKLLALRTLGIDPYPSKSSRRHTCSEAAQIFIKHEDEAKPRSTSVAGRILRLRNMGKASFIDIEDRTGRLQLFIRANESSKSFDLVDNLDLGDFVSASGNLMRTRLGEISVQVKKLSLLTKAMRPPPDAYYGLNDKETRYRQRYLDLIANKSVEQVMRTRSKIISSIRNFMDKSGFVEVETPVLVNVPAGAMANPFITEHRALNRRLFLRIATELYLKRLIVGGMDKVYEIGRVFRNEGIDHDHNPEFTLLESYEAYSDYLKVMGMVEKLVPAIAKSALGATTIEFQGSKINLLGPWPRIKLKDAIKQYSGVNIDDAPDAASMTEILKNLGIAATYAESRGRLIDKLLSTYVEPNLIQPTFLIDYPLEMSPLAKAKTTDPQYTERFEAYAGGMEIANAFSELNDPEAQRSRLDEQEQLRKQYQGEELDRIDEDFIIALEHGMPPTGGLGIGIDRLVMLLTSQESIRDVLLFPQVRSLGNES